MIQALFTWPWPSHFSTYFFPISTFWNVTRMHDSQSFTFEQKLVGHWSIFMKFTQCILCKQTTSLSLDLTLVCPESMYTWIIPWIIRIADIACISLTEWRDKCVPTNNDRTYPIWKYVYYTIYRRESDTRWGRLRNSWYTYEKEATGRARSRSSWASRLIETWTWWMGRSQKVQTPSWARRSHHSRRDWCNEISKYNE